MGSPVEACRSAGTSVRYEAKSLTEGCCGCRNGDVKASRRGDGASVASYILTKEKAYTAANFGATSSTVATRFGGANSTAFSPLVVNQVCLTAS
jgi:Haem-degrading